MVITPLRSSVSPFRFSPQEKNKRETELRQLAMQARMERQGAPGAAGAGGMPPPPPPPMGAAAGRGALAQRRPVFGVSNSHGSDARKRDVASVVISMRSCVYLARHGHFATPGCMPLVALWACRRHCCPPWAPRQGEVRSQGSDARVLFLTHCTP